MEGEPLPPPIDHSDGHLGELRLDILLPMSVAVGLPLGFLVLVRRLDLYASGGFHVVVACLLGGLAAFPLSFALNTRLLGLATASLGAAAAILWIKTVAAPVVEEIAKSLGLLWAARGTQFSYFVDGAIYGFAAGTAFAVIENLFYLQQASDPLGMAVNRAFSTSLMHGSASALVGVSLGRFRFGRGHARLLALTGGWAAAILMHMGFNRLVNSGSIDTFVLVLAYAIGLGGLGLTMLFIRWGLREEAVWLRETLGLDIGVSRQESAVVQQLADLDRLLGPFEAHFGTEKRMLAERFLRLQARLGLKVKAASMAGEQKIAGRLQAEADALREEMDGLRRELGVYCMSYLRSILPSEDRPLWSALEQAIAEAPAPTTSLWQRLERHTE